MVGNPQALLAQHQLAARAAAAGQHGRTAHGHAAAAAAASNKDRLAGKKRKAPEKTVAEKVGSLWCLCFIVYTSMMKGSLRAELGLLQPDNMLLHPTQQR